MTACTLCLRRDAGKHGTRCSVCQRAIVLDALDWSEADAHRHINRALGEIHARQNRGTVARRGRAR